jgi:hypothetical protein
MRDKVFYRRATAILFAVIFVVWLKVWWPLALLMLAALAVWFVGRVLVG